ncbi:hypothetical protein [Staphylococcus phage ZCSS1]|nr:hypothetical protein [Staphylococcus phage ZCSS1]
MNKKDMLNLLDHLITQSRYWHLEFAKKNIIQSEYEKIESYRDKFDRDLLKKGEDIINGIETESNIVNITVFLKGYKVLLSKNDYTTHQLRQILESLKAGHSIDDQNSNKKIYINKDNIVGFDVTYESDYKNKFHKE